MMRGGSVTLLTVERPPDLGRRLRAAREYRGLSQGALAQAIKGISQSAVARYEKGELPDDRKLASVLEDWALVCEVPGDWFTAPWASVGTTPGAAAHPDEPEWVGRLEDQLKLILGVLRASSDAEADSATELLADAGDGRRQSMSRRRRAG